MRTVSKGNAMQMLGMEKEGGETLTLENLEAEIKKLHWFKAVAEKLHKQLLQESKRFGFTVPATLDDVVIELKGGE